MASGQAPFIPLVDLRQQRISLEDELRPAIEAAVERGDYILGGSVASFEQAFAAHCGAGHAVGCGNGTDALQLALRALGVGPGDEVLVPAMTYAATSLAVELCGATSVLVDVDGVSGLIDPDLIDAAVTERTRGVIAVHLFGQCADMAAIEAAAERNGLWVIEDAAQAHGATDKRGRVAGSMGRIGCFSFYPSKNLGAFGDGGAMTTQDPEIAALLKRLRNMGSETKYHHDVVGTNSRLDTLQAAVLEVKLPHLADWNRRRVEHAKRYDRVLAAIPGVTLTSYDDGAVYHLYVIRVDDRDRVLAALQENGIGAGLHYPLAIHQLSFFTDKYGEQTFANAADWAARCISLPIYAELPDEAPERVAAILSSVL